jgi:outer membrane autotransporter protein
LFLLEIYKLYFKDLNMKKNQIALALSAFFSLSISAYAAEKPPTEVVPKETAPDVAAIIAGPGYEDHFSVISGHWNSGYSTTTVNGADNKYLAGHDISRVISGLATQMVRLQNGAYSLNNNLNSTQLNIESGSTAVNTYVIGGIDGLKGVLSVQGADSKAYNTVIGNDGSINVYSGAQAYNTTVNQGGIMVVGSSGYAQANIIDGGTQRLSVSSTAIAEDTIVINGGQQLIDGGTAINSHIGAGSYQLAGGLSQETKVYSGGFQLVYSNRGGDIVADQNSTIYLGGTQRIQSGISENAAIYGEQIVSRKNGDWVNGSWVEGSGYWGSTPVSRNATIYAGGVQRLEEYGSAVGAVIDGGKQLVNERGWIEATTIKNGGSSTIAFGAYSRGRLDVLDGSLTMVGGDTHNWTGVLGDGAYAQHVNLAGQNAKMYIQHNDTTSYSTVTVGTLESNGGVVIFGREDGSDAGKFSYLDVETLKGNGLIVMNTDIANGQGDFLYVENKIADADSFKVAIRDSGNDVVDYRHHIITAGGDSTSDSFSIHQNYSRADAGAYMVQYTLEHSTDSANNQENWHLVTSRLNITTPSTDAALAMANTTPTIVDAELSTLRQRLGDLEYNGHNNGVWGKYITSRYKVDKESGAAYQQDMNGFVIGADRASSQDNGTLHTGIMGGYSRSDIDFKRGGDGKVDSYTLGAYATFIGNSGLYVDGVAKYNYFRHKTDAISSHGDAVTGKYNTSGAGISLEVGKKYERPNLFSVPYVMLSGFYAGSADYTLSNKMHAKVGRAASAKAEFGHVLGKNIKLSNGSIKPYLRTAVSQELVNSNKVLINGNNSFNNDMSGTAMKVGVGATAQLGKNTGIYAEINYMKATHINMPYSGNVGFRYSF